MALNSIGARRTPGAPIEIDYAAFLGVPLDTQRILIVGRIGASPGTGSADTLYKLVENIDPVGARAEVEGRMGVSEVADQVVDFINTAADGAVYPALWFIGVPYDADITNVTLDNAIAAIDQSPFDGVVWPVPLSLAAEVAKIKAYTIAASAPGRVANQQFGTISIIAALDGSGALSDNTFDTRNMSVAWIEDSGASETVGQIAAQYGARVFANPVPFNPINKQPLLMPAPVDESEWIAADLSGRTETALNAGITPLSSDRGGAVRIVRSVTMATTQDEAGGAAIQSYFDVQDIQVLHYFRRALWTRLVQTDFQNVKNTDAKRRRIRTEAISMAKRFERSEMLQHVDLLAPFFQIEVNESDRTRVDFRIPINVIPGLHVLAGSIEAGTMFDVITA